ncbi:MAG: ATP-binding protein [Actinomycetota bacterium]|nr:ATP-binding protein [Actinomycetota bacterium]
MTRSWAPEAAQPDLDAGPDKFADIARRALRPPLGDRRFWMVQVVVVFFAALHLLVDLHSSGQTGAFPGGIPVALLIIPVGYAAVRYGLTGSAATAAWASLLWLPDLLLPGDQGHAPSDLVNLLLVDGVALFFGQRIEVERRAHARVERATLGRLAAEARYHQLFEANLAPILVLDAREVVRAANPAATALFGDGAIGTPATELIDAGLLEELDGRVVTLGDGHDYRVAVAKLPEGGDDAAQLVFEDVTKERSETRRAARQRALMVAAEEEQRRRLARELHDEPLQLLLHLARRFETLGESTGVPAAVASSLEDARLRALEAATRLRNLARDLRPPALDQLGLVPALSSFLAEAEDDSGLLVDFEVSGEKRRLHPDVELGAFRIVQEAVRNALRHARAREVRVHLAFDPDLVRLDVADDGVGFVVEGEGRSGEHSGPGRSGEHLGLVGMAERASLLGGRLEVHSVLGRGTDVRAWLPNEPGGGPTSAE